MSEDKRYYWIKLKDNFFTSDTIDFLMSQDNGAEYVVLYQMLCLKTVNNQGRLVREIGEVIVPYDAKKIARDFKFFSLDTVLIALELYKRLHLIYESEDGILTISGIGSLVGSTYNDDHIREGNRIRKQRERERKKIAAKESEKSTDVTEDVTRDVTQKCHRDIDIRDRDNVIVNVIDNVLSSSEGTSTAQIGKNSEAANEIIGYLNEKSKSRYSAGSKRTKELISGRLSEGYTVDDFKKVIDVKCNEWMSKKEMRPYLRPDTLFRPTNFEEYLNQAIRDEAVKPKDKWEDYYDESLPIH